MSQGEDGKAVVRAYFERAMAGDPNLSELFTDDVSWWVPPGSPLGGTHRGKAAVLEMLSRAFALYDVPTMKLDLELLMAEGNLVCVLFHLESRTTRGTQHAADYLALFETERGRIRSVREFFDTHTVRKVVFGLPA
jgi:ketosteroid isomerase-like protein